MSRLKILFIVAWYPTKDNPVNGVFVREHAKAVLLYNDVVVLHSLGIAQSVNGLYEILDEMGDGIRTVRVRYQKSLIPKTTYLIYLLSMFSTFRKLMREGFKPDIIHAHIFSAGVPAVILGRLYGIPTIITEHFSGFPRRLLSPFEQKEAKFAMNRARLILPVNKSLQRAIQSYGIRNKFQIVPNAVNTVLFHPSPDGYKQKARKEKKILLVALLTPIKGVPYLLEALSQIRKKRDDFLLDIIGDGPNREEYEDMALELGLSDKVKFHGLKTKQQVAEYMRKCDFFVLPSVFETFSVVTIEALACGKPVIATFSGGPEDFVTKEVGILIPIRDVNSLANAVNYMLDNYQNYSSERIAEYARERFSLQAVGQALNGIYRELVSK